MQTPTVMINTPNGPVRINESDFDEKSMTLHKGKEANETNEAPVAQVGSPVPLAPGLELPPAPSAPNLDGNAVPPTVPSPGQMFVVKDGKKFFVTGADGVRTVREGIDDKGYTTEQDAWNAVIALPR
jgi:hypothetical protein